MARTGRTATMDLELTDLTDREMYDNPYERYAYLREHAPVSRVRWPLMVPGTGYMLTRYDDVAFLHSDPRFSVNLLENGGHGRLMRLMPKLPKLLLGSMEFKDDPDHRRLRMLVSMAFTPKFVGGMTGYIERTTAELIDTIAAKRDIDLVDDFAVRLPLSVIATMLGVSDDDRDRFHAMTACLATGASSLSGMIRALPSSNRLAKFFQHLADEARRSPNNGLISALIRANDGDDRLTDQEVLSMIFLLLLAGHDTTANLITSSMLTLLDRPEELARLRGNPDLWDTAIEELLRFTTPVPCGSPRIAMEDVEVAGTVIPKGSYVVGMIISANRDPSVFPDPDRLDLARDPNKHLSFAFGAHYCLGNRLARTEARIALRALLERFDDVRITVPRSRLRYRPIPALRGLESLPMRVG